MIALIYYSRRGERGGWKGNREYCTKIAKGEEDGTREITTHSISETIPTGTPEFQNQFTLHMLTMVNPEPKNNPPHADRSEWVKQLPDKI